MIRLEDPTNRKPVGSNQKGPHKQEGTNRTPVGSNGKRKALFSLLQAPAVHSSAPGMANLGYQPEYVIFVSYISVAVTKSHG